MRNRFVTLTQKRQRKLQAYTKALYSLHPNWEAEDAAIREFWRLFQEEIRRTSFGEANERLTEAWSIDDPIARLEKAKEILSHE